MNYKQIIASRKETYKEFARNVYEIMGHGEAEDMPEEYYQHIMQLLDGKVKPRKNEAEAIEFYIELTRNPMKFARQTFLTKNLERWLRHIRKCLTTKTYNKNKEVRKLDSIIKELK